MVIEGDPEFTRAEYRYDALGRRTEKQVWRRHARKPERTQYAWSGLQMVGERSDSDPDAAVQYVYTENSYEPLARIDSQQQHAEMYWYHTEINGLPEKVTDSRGEIVWRGTSTAWGRSQHESVHAEWDVPQNLRFQGQYLDRETGLHYNTFRYYDPTGGCYTQMDPIGLQGGLNTYTYVVDPLGWVDPLGLAGCSLPSKVNLTRGGVQHVKERHVGNKIGWEHKNKWVIGNAEWKSTVRHVFRNPDRITRDGSRFVYEKTLSKAVGRTPEGEVLTKVRVVVESNGDLVTAFPQSVFRDAKITDMIL
ncbi:RHS repeat-associated core domain-containing protein [Kosakonia oryzendophytica]|uniref:RHS repeat-associated core domain-containing protein n=1 Tax=Kosakonia oryzendophytica TaxID=1005665 RepID=A0A1C4C115_9ENTR|nr:RHS repeat-associated core domain-containing protein [Kosakonia oryzendophytica]